MTNNLILKIIICILAWIVASIYAPVVYNHTGDLAHFIRWAQGMKETGVFSIYKHGTDYPPVFQFVLGLFSISQNSNESIAANINDLKAYFLFFDVLAVIYSLIEFRRYNISEKWQWIFMASTLLNPAFWYNSLIWGQVDSLYTFMLVAAFWAALEKNIIKLIVFSVLALNSKIYAFIFFPVFFIMVMDVLWASFSIKNLIKWILASVITQLIIVFPFITIGEFVYFKACMLGAFKNRPVDLSTSAYNLWFILFA
ncbi:MAG: hypothetical protein MUF43_08255 [Flavobacterium sp.]|nr:hypothetical protein [Flavobacterium sp.]